MPSPFRLAAVALVLALGTACHNACQDICDEMANYAEDKCGFTVGADQIAACVDAEAGKNLDRDDRQACRQFGNRRSIDAEWGCEELADYFDAPAGGGDTP
jgi:hypothetical protein